MNIHYFQHVAFEGPGYIATWMKEKGHTLTGTHFFEDTYTIPELSSIDMLVVMGGPMSVYDDHLYDWLPEEKAYIEDAIQAGKKVLGVCLGAQLAALCLGAYVPTSLHKEIGWYPVYRAGEAAKVAPVISNRIRQYPMVFHWHGDKFDIPYGAYELAWSEANSNQGFLHKDHVLGLQFHAEMTAPGLELMLEHGHKELIAGAHIQDAAAVRAGSLYIEDSNKLMAHILEGFLSGNL